MLPAMQHHLYNIPSLKNPPPHHGQTLLCFAHFPPLQIVASSSHLNKETEEFIALFSEPQLTQVRGAGQNVWGNAQVSRLYVSYRG